MIICANFYVYTSSDNFEAAKGYSRSYHNPALLAKMLSTLDIVRLWCIQYVNSGLTIVNGISP